MKSFKQLSIVLWMLFISSFAATAQKWVDTNLLFQQSNNISYGEAVDFGGNLRTLKLDLCVPSNDTVPSCGRPIMIIVHGGSFLGGSKSTDLPPRIMSDFAKRGFVTASIDYRLGFFQTHSNVHCNISNFGLSWDCVNAADTAEWIRAAYRAQQDIKGALRFLLNKKDSLKINPHNVFLVGESAGAIAVLMAGFMDNPSEKPNAALALANAYPPNSIYEGPCIQNLGLDTSIASLQLQRPDLGAIQGTLNHSSQSFKLKGVGAFYGGIFEDLFTNAAYTEAPRLYLFHQPNDLIVPYNRHQILQGLAYCATQWPANCVWIINRPYIYGSSAIKHLINQLPSTVVKPTILLDSTTNSADCSMQIANPSTTGHAVDYYCLRTKNMALFFAPAIDTTNTCTVGIGQLDKKQKINLSPNPAQNEITIYGMEESMEVVIKDALGKTWLQVRQSGSGSKTISVKDFSAGIYYVGIFQKNEQVALLKFVKKD